MVGLVNDDAPKLPPELASGAHVLPERLSHGHGDVADLAGLALYFSRRTTWHRDGDPVRPLLEQSVSVYDHERPRLAGRRECQGNLCLAPAGRCDDLPLLMLE